MNFVKVRMFWIALAGSLLLITAAATAYHMLLTHIGAVKCIPLMMPV